MSDYTLMVGDLVRLQNVGWRRISYISSDRRWFKCGSSYYIPSDIAQLDCYAYGWSEH